MVAESQEIIRVNARRQDAFDVYNFQTYDGPNPYLKTGALVFDFALTLAASPLEIEDYLREIADRYPQLGDEHYPSYAHLFARTVSEVGKLDMGLHWDAWSIQVGERIHRIAVQSIHHRTQKSVVYAVWDWFEAIAQNKDYAIAEQIHSLQNIFRASVYGGPTVYALFRTAQQQEIPAFYLWDEGLMQYGYGCKQVRGIATTFDSDSHLDSDFTTRKDDCKAFLNNLGFPVPQGEIVRNLEQALAAARRVGYPVAVKPVVGHKGIGVTADIQDGEELEAAFQRAIGAIEPDAPVRVIVEQSIRGADFRLLCVNGRFVAATERRPASVVGDGDSTIAELIRRENRSSARRDTPTSPLSKIQCDEAMEQYLEEQRLTLDSVLDRDQEVFLRKVANLSSGGLSIDATATIHPDNVVLVQDIAQHFRLTCLGIDVIAESLSQSWKHSDFAILEINAAPGVFMHLNPAVGDSVDVPAALLETFFKSSLEARIPILTFNQITRSELQETIDHILLQHPDWTIGAVCKDGVFINRSEKVLNADYNLNIQSLLRNPKLNLLIAEYPEETLEKNGMFYFGSNLVVLNNPTETERVLTRDIFDHSTVVIKEGNSVSIRRQGLVEQYELGDAEPFIRVYLKEIATVV